MMFSTNQAPTVSPLSTLLSTILSHNCTRCNLPSRLSYRVTSLYLLRIDSSGLPANENAGSASRVLRRPILLGQEPDNNYFLPTFLMFPQQMQTLPFPYLRSRIILFRRSCDNYLYTHTSALPATELYLLLHSILLLLLFFPLCTSCPSETPLLLHRILPCSYISICP